MKPLLDLSVGQRLGAGLSLIAVALVAFVLTVLSWQQAGDVAQREYARRIAPASEQAFALERALLHADIAVRGYLIAPEAARQMEALEGIERAQRGLSLIMSLPRDADGAKILATLEPAVTRYLERARRLARVDPRLMKVEQLQVELSDLRRTAAENLRAYLELQGSKAEAAIAAMEGARQKMSEGMLSAVGLVLGVLGVLAFFTMQMVRRPTRALLHAAAELERGRWEPALKYSSEAWAAQGKPVPQRNELARIGHALASAARALEQRETRLMADARVAAAASSSLEREPMAMDALRAMIEATGAVVGVIYAYDAEDGQLRPIARHALSDTAAIQAAEGLPGEALRQRRMVVIRDIPDDSAFRLRLGIDDWTPRAVAAVPILLRDEALGVAVLGCLRDFEPAALAFMPSACLQLAIGLKNVRSHEEVQRLVAELRESTERVKRQNQELALADEHKNEFLGLLAHELRNPLAAIAHSVYILGRPEKTADDDAHGRTVIERQMRHLTRMVDDLLDVTRIARGKVRLQREPLDLAQLVRDVLHDWQAGIDKAGLKLEAEVPAEPAIVEGDRTRLAQVLGNLLSNALKFTEPGQRLAVSLRRDDARRRLTLRVADSGMGIEGALLEQLFEPFSQGETGLARGNGGLGLGLALARALVEMHDGTIEAKSDGPGRGAEFVVTLPLAAATLPLPTPTLAAPHARRPRRVLIVEDNADAAETLATALRFEGHDVRVCGDGLEGMEAARAMRPEIVLCDLGIPGIDGFEVARRMRADEALRSIVLVALSGYASAEDQRRSAQAGFDHHLSKPIDIDQLLDLLGSLTSPRPAPRAQLAPAP